MTHDPPQRSLRASVLGAAILIGGLGLMACGGGTTAADEPALQVTTADTTAPATTEAPTTAEPATTTTDEPYVCTNLHERGTFENHESCVNNEWVARPERRPTTTTAPPTTTPPAPVETVPTPPPAPAYNYSYTVVDVIDGDTVDLSNGETVRLIGIDAPEMGTCGSQEAKDAVVNGVLGRQVALESAPGIIRDRYGRLLRYVIVDNYDVGGALLRAGFAIPRYNSTDGYGWHPREAEYFAIAAPPMTCAPPPAPAAPVPQGGGCDPNYSGCVPIASDVDCAGGSGNGPEYVSGPVRVIGEDIYGLDGNDNDGIGCEGSSSSGSGSGGSSGGGNSSPRNNDNPYDDGGPRNPDGSCPPGGCT